MDRLKHNNIGICQPINSWLLIGSQNCQPQYAKTETISGELLVNSAEWDADNKTICYSTMDAINGYKLHRSAGITYPKTFANPAVLARGAANSLFVNTKGSNTILQVDDTQLADSPITATDKLFAGAMPMQSHSVTTTGPAEINLYTRALGNKRYELTDHLGNVRATVSDRLFKVSPSGGDLEGASSFIPDLQSTATYYPFGMTIGGLSSGSEGYRFGFNGKPTDLELNDWQDYGERMYMKRLGRFPTPDPLIIYGRKYPELSSYQFASNTPIQAIDLDGLEAAYTRPDGIRISGSDHLYNGNPKFLSPTVMNLMNKQGAMLNKAKKEHDAIFGYKDPGSIKSAKSNYEKHWEASTHPEMQNFIKFNPVIKPIAVAGAATMAAPLFALEASPWLIGLKGSISTGIQYAIKKEVDAIDVVGDAFFVVPMGNASFNTLSDLNIGKNGMSFNTILNKNNVGFEFTNTLLWGTTSNAAMKSISPLLREGSEKLLFETITGLPTTVGEEGSQKIINQKTGN